MRRHLQLATAGDGPRSTLVLQQFLASGCPSVFNSRQMTLAQSLWFVVHCGHGDCGEATSRLVLGLSHKFSLKLFHMGSSLMGHGCGSPSCSLSAPFMSLQPQVCARLKEFES